MNKAIFTLICATLLVLGVNPLSAQNITSDWARQIYSSIPSTFAQDDIAIDKMGNIYTLYHSQGTITVDGNSTPDSTSATVLASWDCQGNLRWMKSFGGTGNFPNNIGEFVEQIL